LGAPFPLPQGPSTGGKGEEKKDQKKGRGGKRPHDILYRLSRLSFLATAKVQGGKGRGEKKKKPIEKKKKEKKRKSHPKRLGYTPKMPGFVKGGLRERARKGEKKGKK